MLIDSVMEMASISVISKDGQETNHSQCPWDGRLRSRSPVAPQCQERARLCQIGLGRAAVLPFHSSALRKEGMGLARGDSSPPVALQRGWERVPSAWRFPRGTGALGYPLLRRRRRPGAGACVPAGAEAALLVKGCI